MSLNTSFDHLSLGHRSDTLDKLVKQLDLKVHNVNGWDIYIHNNGTLLLDAFSLQMISVGRMKLHSVFEQFKEIQIVIISCVNLSVADSLFCKVIRDILCANLQKLRVIGCELPAEVKEKDLKILKINGIDHQIESLEIIDWVVGRKEKKALKKIVQCISDDSSMNFSIQSESDS